MAKSNRDRVADVMDILKSGLAPYILRMYKQVYKDRYLQEIEITLYSDVYSVSLPDEASAHERVDTQGWLNLLSRRWKEVFGNTLSQTERNYVSELAQSRNDWAHQKAFTNEMAQRVADTATLLLTAIGSSEAVKTRYINAELRRLLFDAEQRQAQKPVNGVDMPTTTKQGLKPWRLVVTPHPDVASGNYLQAEFAADLAQVTSGQASVEYSDPQEFFRRTYLTEGLMQLLVTGVKRMSGQGGDPVVQLQTNFGGGKTHSMLAMYHLFGGKIGISQIPTGEKILEQVAGVDDVITANRAVIVGTAFDANKPHVYADCTTYTLWGEIAYQLGGVEGYRQVEESDLTGMSPGSDTLVSLLEAYGPALIIIDELVAFARNLYGATTRPVAGTFDSVMTFMQVLTEAVKRSSDSMLLVSIPASDNEVGSEGGKVALNILAKTIGRIESVWKPVSATESFEIVRRRLFSSDIDYASRDAVVSAFRDMYLENKSEFPTGVSENDYFLLMKQAYPIHPELFERLYEDWSTLDNFQRTRGVLRFMASVIYLLWQERDQSLLIMPGSIPLFSGSVRNEILRYLPESWSAIVDADIDGQNSKPFQLDQSVSNLGRYSASRRVARAIFMGSAPSGATQSVRGIEEARIRLATVQPGEPLAIFGDALRRMANQLAYLYAERSRYWYDTRVTVNRTAQERAQNISEEDISQEAKKRLRGVEYDKREFNGVHIAPDDSADIADEARVRIVVFSIYEPHQKGKDDSRAQEVAKIITENRGNGLRLYRNMLVFVAPDAVLLENWKNALREYLAWRSIEEDAEQLNLDIQQRKQVEANLKRTDDTANSQLQEAYSWMIVPTQNDPMKPINYEAHSIKGQDTFYRRASYKLTQNEWIIHRWSPDHLLEELNRYLWRNAPHVGIKQLWDYFAQHPYLPRLFDYKVLHECIQTGVSREDAPPFAYASVYGVDETYKGLVMGRILPAIYGDDKEVILRPDVAQAQLDMMNNIPKMPLQPTPPLSSPMQKGASVSEPPKRKVMRRFHGSAILNPQRVTKDVSTIADEVIQHLTSLRGANVTITIEISAEHPDGFDDATVRTVTENSRTLKFKTQGFEE